VPFDLQGWGAVGESRNVVILLTQSAVEEGAGVILGGVEFNNFTGNVEIPRAGQYVDLVKENGETAILGNINVGVNSSLGIWRSNQIADFLTVRLENSSLFFGGIHLGCE